MAKDYYQTLGVARGASADEIKKAYRKLAHAHHPDKKGGDEAKFKEINEAYQVLSNKEKRAQYDQFGETFSQGGGGGAGFGGFDFGRGFEGFSNGNFHFEGGFEDIFSDIFGGGRSRGSRSRRRGSDIQVDVEISFEEMAAGVRKTLSLRREVACSLCSGTGGKRGSKEQNCPTCHGAGQVRRTVRSILGTFQQAEVCGDCGGRGKVYAEKCLECRGSGRVKKTDEIPLDIPAGIEDGQMLSLSGEGEAGEAGSQPGDLLVSVHVRPHPVFSRRGNDVLSNISVSAVRAALGDTVDVETIDGLVSMKVPAGTQSGEVFRIRSKGLLPVGSSWGRGDHLVTVTVRVPKHLSREEKRLFEALRDIEK
ncbi:MAG: molecular chaperone DnaJ [Candidatus Moraniibacteriota bacterium]|nr:MAG: molecular chaperone DnaJ [Candidatus Moranbacteria bacterium]